ncbi:MAG TPA: protein kinase [Bryobacteraceae bacterium]|nr:protein kinase [Bryobacteraceae bacterium]
MLTPEHWRQIEDLYHAAQKCDPGQRAALLDGTDAQIRARVERMLEVESSGGLLDQSPISALADPTQTVVAPGAQLGPYKIEAQIGSGGMGTVYRAIDTRLGRVVAIKIASERYSVRFQLEAQAISTLNHPNVCTLYDVGPNYLVMEFIDGRTLAAELKKGPLPPETAARYGAQIAGALAEAHSLNIVHRDLKPSNIMLSKHGVKVLDFGLAKILAATSITQTDAVMGTPAYMAPEQVDGVEPGSATDLFALGLVLYEMSVGRLPFPGASLGQMLSSGAHPAVPAPSRERAGVPASLDGLVSQLLEKDPRRRPQSSAEVSRELTAIAERLAAPPRSPLRAALAAIAAVVLLVGFAFWFYLRSRVPESQLPIANSSSYTQITSFTDAAVDPVLSPDGRMVAFYRSSVGFETRGDIWLKLLPDGEPIQVTHDARAKYNIAFSPDGGQLAYTVFPRVAQLFDTFTVPTLGGDSRLFLPNAAGLSWLDDKHLLFSQIKGGGVHMGIVTADADRSGLREIYFPSLERGMAHYSYLSPDRKWILLQEMNPAWGPCRVVPFAGDSPGRLVGPPGAICTSSAWSHDGKSLYLGVLVAGRYHIWRQPFPNGQPEQITFGSNDEFGIAMAPDGRSFITSILTRQNAVSVHDSSGDRAISTEGYAEAATPKFSRDGKRLYYLLRRASPESPAELWRADLDSGKSEVVIPGVSMSEFDISPDEKQVIFTKPAAGQTSQLWIAALDRGTPPRPIASGVDAPHFGPKGDVYFRMAEGHTLYVWVVQGDGTGLRKALANPILNFENVSPDGRFLIVTAEVPQVSPPPVLAAPVDGGAVMPFCDDLCTPIWSPDGRYLSMQISDKSGKDTNARTAIIPLPPGKLLPRLTPDLVRDPTGWAKMPGVKVVDGIRIALGLTPSTYAYIKPSVHANLYRIPLR